MTLKDRIRHVAAQEAEAEGVTSDEVIFMGLNGKAIAARRRAMRRIVRETGCSQLALTEAWGCGRDVVSAALRDTGPNARTCYDDSTIARLISRHGAERATRIAQGNDAATNVDLAAWNTLCRRAAA